jgi:beta-glucosidase
MTMDYKNASLSINERVNDLLSRMTVDEKIAQLVQVNITTENRQQIIERIRKTGLGSRILADGNMTGDSSQRTAEIEEFNDLQRVAVEESRLGIPLIHGRDVIHGYRTVFPIPLAMAAGFDPQDVEEAFRIAAREAVSSGVHWSFAPMLDIARDPRWGRIIEGFGEDPYLCAQLAAAAVHGFQGDLDDEGYLNADRILACAKHYIGYGGAEGGRDYNTSEITDNTLRNIYLPPYKAAVEAGVGSVMSAFQDINGESASGSHYLIGILLKGELGFEGFVVSDWGSVAELMNHRLAANEREAARLAFRAGVDMEMATHCYTLHLKDLVASGEIPMYNLDDAVRRILTAKFRLGLFERPYADAAHAPQIQFTPEHQSAARRIAARNMVLLKNEGVLPLAKKGKRIAVIGPFADQRRALLGTWVKDGLIDETKTLLEEVRLACPEAEVLSNSTGLYDEMLMTAAEADVVLLAVGESDARNGENNCVASLDLPAGQEELVNAVAALGKPLVVVVFAGRPVTLTRIIQKADALLYAWHPGSLGAAAVADVVFGDVNPGGKLPVTFPRAEGQIPIHYNHKSTGRFSPRYLDMPAEPLFPFGFGLSYTTFAYQGLEVQPVAISPGESVKVSVTVTNTGSSAGEEVVQCYVQDCVSGLTRPVKELKGFTRLTLKPGESRRVEFILGPNELSYYGPGGKWVLEPGEFKVGVGGDSLVGLDKSFVVREK